MGDRRQRRKRKRRRRSETLNRCNSFSRASAKPCARPPAAPSILITFSGPPFEPHTSIFLFFLFFSVFFFFRLLSLARVRPGPFLPPAKLALTSSQIPAYHPYYGVIPLSQGNAKPRALALVSSSLPLLPPSSTVFRHPSGWFSTRARPERIPPMQMSASRLLIRTAFAPGVCIAARILETNGNSY